MKLRPIAALNVAIDFGRGPQPVGRLAGLRGRFFFEYAAEFLSDPLPISPFRLPARPGVHEGPAGLFAGLHGLFDDSLPDGWGRLLLDRELDRLGIARSRVSPLDRLAYVGAQGMGALVYEPAMEVGSLPEEVDLHGLALGAQQILEGDGAAVLQELLALGGSSGGARPKVLVDVEQGGDRIVHGTRGHQAGFEPWLIKFSNQGDGKFAGAIEQSYALMAAACGIAMTPSRLFAVGDLHPGYFGACRFDRRADGGRRHMHSLAGLMHADHRVPSIGYEGLLKATRALCRDEREVKKMALRMVFNLLAHNRDDHSRNFSFLLTDEGEWQCSPAYDLTFSAGPNGEHWMDFAGEGRDPGRSHLDEVAARVGLPKRFVQNSIDQVATAVEQWPQWADDCGVPAAEIRRIAKVHQGLLKACR